MELFVGVIALIFAAGVGIALFEWRKGKVLLKHDLRLKSQGQTETDRETMRAEDNARTRIMFDHMS